jgi:hypothetical protein
VDSFKCWEKIKIQSGNKNIVLRLMVLCESTKDIKKIQLLDRINKEIVITINN